MTRSIWNGLATLGVTVALALSGTLALAADAPGVGDPAPEFSLKGSDGKTYSLSDFKGEKAVVLAWFPRAFTPGCTRECKAFAEQGDQLKSLNVAYFTVSTDDAETNTRFAESLEVDYPILSDPDGSAAKAFGVLNPERGFAQRWTFYIDKEGIIREIDREIDNDNAGADVASKLKELGIASE